MRVIGTLTVGYLHGRISALLRGGLLSRFHSVLITSLDSTTDIATSSIGVRIVRSDPRCSFLGAGLIVPGDALNKIDASLKPFSGFDELWCFEHPPAVAKPANLWIVSPLNIELEGPPSHLASWMSEANCALGLGDGVGLNFATSLKEIAFRLEGFDFSNNADRGRSSGQ